LIVMNYYNQLHFITIVTGSVSAKMLAVF